MIAECLNSGARWQSQVILLIARLVKRWGSEFFPRLQLTYQGAYPFVRQALNLNLSQNHVIANQHRKSFRANLVVVPGC